MKGQSEEGNRKHKPKWGILLLDFSHIEGFSEVTYQSKLSGIWSELLSVLESCFHGGSKCPIGFCMDSPCRSLAPCLVGKIEAEWPKQNQFCVTVVFLLPAWESCFQLVWIVHCSDSFSWCSLNIAWDCSWLGRELCFSAFTRWRNV